MRQRSEIVALRLGAWRRTQVVLATLTAVLALAAIVIRPIAASLGLDVTSSDGLAFACLCGSLAAIVQTFTWGRAFRAGIDAPANAPER